MVEQVTLDHSVVVQIHVPQLRQPLQSRLCFNNQAKSLVEEESHDSRVFGIQVHQVR